MLQGTRLRSVIRDVLGQLHRELKVTLTPVPHPDKWVFVVGCYNSGTTLLADVLGRHDKISALPTEGHFITDQIVKDYEIGLPRMWVEREDLFRMSASSEGPDVTRLKKEWAMRLDTRKPVLLEKSPPNAARTQWLQAHFERAHFVAIVRNGYAVAEGIRRKAEPRHLPSQKWPIEMAARQWVRSNEVLLEDGHALEHLMWIKYEDLTENLEPSLQSILDFLELPWDSHLTDVGDLDVHERTGPVRNLNSVSITRLTPEDIDRISNVAGEMLARFDYPILQGKRSARPGVHPDRGEGGSSSKL